MDHISIESAKTVLEVAELAFTAAEFSHHHHPLHYKNGHPAKSSQNNERNQSVEVIENELDALRLENQRLSDLLQQNLQLLRNVSESPCLLEDCPVDLHTRIMDTIESPKFLSQLKTFQKDTVHGIPDEILINDGYEEPSLWVWVSDETVHGNVEEKSGIDDENYVVVSQEQVVDGIASFMARCIMLNPKAKNLTPEEMQKSKFYVYEKGSNTKDFNCKKELTKALGGMSKFEKLLELWHAGQLFYLMATWGLALAGLDANYYREPGVSLEAASLFLRSRGCTRVEPCYELLQREAMQQAKLLWGFCKL